MLAKCDIRFMNLCLLSVCLLKTAHMKLTTCSTELYNSMHWKQFRMTQWTLALRIEKWIFVSVFVLRFDKDFNLCLRLKVVFRLKTINSYVSTINRLFCFDVFGQTERCSQTAGGTNDLNVEANIKKCLSQKQRVKHALLLIS